MAKLTNLQDHFLSHLGEEAGEIGQAIGKLRRFGAFDRKTPAHPTNLQAIRNEVHDVIRVYKIFMAEMGEDPSIDVESVSGLTERSVKSLQYSVDRGVLTPEEAEEAVAKYFRS